VCASVQKLLIPPSWLTLGAIIIYLFDTVQLQHRAVRRGTKKNSILLSDFSRN